MGKPLVRTAFGERVRTARKHAKLTQKSLADAIGAAQSTITDMEQFSDRSAYVVQIAQACRVSAAWLATGEGQMTLGFSTPNIKASLGPGETLPEHSPVVQALSELDHHLNQLAPIFRDSGRDVLRKWVTGAATIEEAADALEAMAMASQSIGKK